MQLCWCGVTEATGQCCGGLNRPWGGPDLGLHPGCARGLHHDLRTVCVFLQLSELRPPSLHLGGKGETGAVHKALGTVARGGVCSGCRATSLGGCGSVWPTLLSFRSCTRALAWHSPGLQTTETPGLLPMAAVWPVKNPNKERNSVSVGLGHASGLWKYFKWTLASPPSFVPSPDMFSVPLPKSRLTPMHGIELALH